MRMAQRPVAPGGDRTMVPTVEDHAREKLTTVANARKRTEALKRSDPVWLQQDCPAALREVRTPIEHGRVPAPLDERAGAREPGNASAGDDHVGLHRLVASGMIV